MNILIVDDEPLHLGTIKAAFAAAGAAATFSEASSLREYREQVQKQQPDIAILDLNLPDGKATEVLHSPPENNPFPILIMTGQGDQKVAVEALKAGALDYILKSAETLSAMPHHVERAMREWKTLTMRKWMDETLRASQAFLKTVLNTMQGGIILIDPKTRKVIDANLYALKLIGAPREKVIGTDCHRHICPAETGKCPVYDLGRKLEGFEQVLLKHDGGQVPILKTVVKVTLNGRECILEHFVDITERKRSMEKAIQAQKMEVVGRMASGVAHDFNNLLTVILGNCSFLGEGLPEGDPKLVEVENIRKAAEQGATFVRQLLAFSRKQVAKPKALDLNAIAGGMEKLLAGMAGKEVSVKIALGENLARVNGDAGQLEQVVMNLVINARDAMPPEGGTISLETENTRLTGETASSVKDAPVIPPGDYVLLKITDDGSGMSEQVLAHIFEPFFTTKEEGKGTGLGLPTVYDIVRKSGGFMDVKSAPGSGTAFRVYLPALPAAAPEAAAGPGPAAAKASYSILVVEDDEDLRQLTARILRAAGYTVAEAATGKSALTHLLDNFDLLLVDIFLPDILGIELASRLTSGKVSGKVIFTSAFVEKSETREILSKPETLFLPKPFTREALLAKISDALGKPR